jgi:integrase
MACIRKRRGKWVVDYRDGAGIRRWKTCGTKREAEDFLDVERPKTRQWSHSVVDSGVTVSKYGERWLEMIKPTIKPGTHTRYEIILKVHIAPILGHVKVRELHRGRIKGFLASKLSELKPARPNGKPKAKAENAPEPQREPETLARNTVRNIYAALRAMLRAAIDDGVLLSNPAEKLGRQLRLVTSKATRQEDIKAMSREQRRAFLEAAAQEPLRYYALLYTLAGTGMRLGECLGLEPEDVHQALQQLRIDRAILDGEVATPKSGHGRTIDISVKLAEVLSRWDLARKADKLRRGWTDMPRWLFYSDAGTPLDDSNVRKVMTRVLKRAKPPLHFTPHCLRHTYASLMLQQGESPAYVQRQLGHASIQLTVDTYGKWLPTGNKGAVDRLDEVAADQSGSKMVARGGGDAAKCWSWREESNLQPVVYKTTALPIELRQRHSQSTRPNFLLQVFTLRLDGE